MSKYRVVVENKVYKDVRGIPKGMLTQIKEATFSLADDPRPDGYIKLTNQEGYRIRVGDFRILYLIDDKDKKVTITRIKHRREVYR